MRRTALKPTTSSRSQPSPRPRSWLAALLCGWLCAASPGWAQTFVAEWTAAAQGGVAPVGMALATEGGTTYLYVCDAPRGRILKFDTSTGAVAATLGRQGTGNGEFNLPYGIAVHPTSGDLYVAERGNHRVQRITSTGAFVVAWGTQGAAQGQFNEPIGVTLDAAGDVYVTDHRNHRVQKFRVAQTAGAWAATPVATWGTAGSGNGQFNLPYGIVADAAGGIWVADGFNGRVQKFDSAGQFQSVLGAAGSSPGQFVVATWVSVAPGGDVFVTSTNSNPQDSALADANNQWVSRFTPGGTFVLRWGGTLGSGQGQFRLPFSAVVGPANRAYVADFYNNRVQVFDLSAPGGGGPGPDTTAPTVASFTTGTTTSTSVIFNLTFSEPVVGVDAGDFATVTTGGATATVGAVTGSGASYTIPVTFTGTGTVGVNLKTTGTGIADAAGNPFAAGATGPVYTIGTGGGNGGSGTRIVAVTTPRDGTYDKGDELIFTVRFSGPVVISERRDRDDDDDDEDDADAFFTWSAAGASSSKPSSGKVTYKSGSGSTTLTFRYKVKNGDEAPRGILLGTTLQLDDGTVVRDSTGTTLSGAPLTLPWAQNPLSGVVLDAEKSNNGNGRGRGKERLVNLSSRLRVTGGDASRSVVAGFVVTGSAPKPILIRAVGPGLAGFGVRDSLAQPRLQLRDSTGRIVAENDGWNNRLEISVAGDRVGAFKLGNGSKDAALLAALAPGAYTAQVTANGNGIVLVEIYDASSGTEIPSEQIVNISTRGFVGTDDDVLVAGFVITGEAPRRVLIRGIGPALSGFGVPGSLVDPVLKLYRAGSPAAIAQNDNWETPQPISGGATPATGAELTAAASAAGAFPLAATSKDAAIVVLLPPGNYSAVVSGANNTTGAGLVEVYELP